MIFVAGGSGGLGRYVMDYAESNLRMGTHFSKQYKDTLFHDFSVDAKIIEDLRDKISVVIHTIALTDVDKSDVDKRLSYNTTFKSSKHIADACAKHNIPLVYISTNDLFDGQRGLYKEDDIPNPLNYYCIHKLMSEEYISNICPRYAIIRCSLLQSYSSFKTEPLIISIFKQIQSDRECGLFHDSYNSPVYVGNVSKICLNQEIWSSNKVFHLYSNRVSKSELGTIASKIMKRPIRISERSIDDMSFIAKRPKDVSLLSVHDVMRDHDIENEVLCVYREWMENNQRPSSAA